MAPVGLRRVDPSFHPFRVAPKGVDHQGDQKAVLRHRKDHLLQVRPRLDPNLLLALRCLLENFHPILVDHRRHKAVGQEGRQKGSLGSLHPPDQTSYQWDWSD